MIEIMTTKDLSDYLQVHPSTIYRLLKRNEIPHFKVGTNWRFLRAAIDIWASEHTIKPPHE